MLAVRVLLAVLLFCGSAVSSHGGGTLDVSAVTAYGATLPTATVTINGQVVERAVDGVFRVEGSGGRVGIEAPAYMPAELAWDGTAGEVAVVLHPRPVFALHVAGTVAAEQWPEMMGIAEATAVNALVIDLKDETGRVFSETPSGIAATVGASVPLFDLRERTANAHDAGLYVIVRIVAFQDPISARQAPSWAIFDPATNGPYRRGPEWYLDPWDADARNYVLTLAEDACAMGVDEVQFDYVRFPVDYPAGAAFDGPTTAAGRSQAIATLMAEARTRLSGEGCAVAADIFGFITSSPGDGGIGQQLESLAEVSDVLSPMVYPSHYSSGWFGFREPNDHPYQVVAQAVADGKTRLEGTAVVLRPWLQAFSYTPSQLGAEIRSADDIGVGWMLWNSASRFKVDGIPQAGTLDLETTRGGKKYVTPSDPTAPSPGSPGTFGLERLWLAIGGGRGHSAF